MGKICGTHGEIRNEYRVFVGNMKGKDSFEDLGVDGRHGEANRRCSQFCEQRLDIIEPSIG
jgi:hypothetical protein